jgi:hypothetical protein
MRYDNIKQLKQTIKRLKEENEFLQKGIDSREDAHNYVCEQRDKSMALTQEITFLLLYIESIQELIKDDYSSNAKTIKRAIGKFKQELTDGFSCNHMILKLNNNNDTKDMTQEI